jgi:hypothetical protein
VFGSTFSKVENKNKLNVEVFGSTFSKVDRNINF